jgi:hypothetical protein
MFAKPITRPRGVCRARPFAYQIGVQLRGEAAQRGHAIARTQMPRGDRGPETLADLEVDRQLLPPIDFDAQGGCRYGHDGLADKGRGTNLD